MLAKKEFRKRVFQYSFFGIVILIFNFIASSRLANADFPLYSNITIFLLININIILLLVLVILIFRNVGKLFLDRKKNVFGTRLQTKLVVFSIVLTILPVFIVFTFSNSIINNSINRWFDVQIEKALESSLELMHKYQLQVEQDLIDQTDIFSRLISSKELLLNRNHSQLNDLIVEYMGDNNVAGVAIYNNQKTRLIKKEREDYFKYLINDDAISQVINNKKIAKYKIFENEQIYWIGVPISSSVNRNVVLGTLFVYNLAPPDQAKKVNKILESYSNYRQIKFFSEPVKNSYRILLVLMTLLVVFAGIWGSLVFSRSITEPVEVLSDASLKISQGNLDVTLESTGNDEIGFLIRSFNDMTLKLKEHDKELHSTNKKLSEMYLQISRDNQYIDTIFKNVNSAIFLFDNNNIIIKTNDKAQKYIVGEKTLYQEDILVYLLDFLKEKRNETNIQFEVMVDKELKIFSQAMTKIYDQNNKMTNIVVVVDDLTELVSLQRISIWRDFATRIAHEIKNPLTPIKLTAERLKKRFKDIGDSDLKTLMNNGMDMIINESNELYNLVKEFSDFSRIPKLNKKKFNVYELFGEIVTMYEQSNPVIDFRLNCNDNIYMYADKSQTRQVFINLINNSIFALKDVKDAVVNIDILETTEKIVIKFRDNGKGISKNDIPNIFKPYFSKRPDGTGLGLPIVKNIIEEHKGKIIVESEKGKFTEFTVEFLL